MLSKAKHRGPGCEILRFAQDDKEGDQDANDGCALHDKGETLRMTRGGRLG